MTSKSLRYTHSNIPRWRKLLYIKQQQLYYPDNYTDSSFLSQLKRNSTVIKHTYQKLILDFLLISLHLDLLALLYVVFFGILWHDWDEKLTVMISTLTSSLVYIGIFNKGNTFIVLKSSFLIALTILTLSPVLKSLSKSTSSDSIWSISFWLSIGYLILNNYQFDLSCISLNNQNFLATNAMFANVMLLASRLKDNLQVFSFILLSFQVAGLFPIFNNWLRLKQKGDVKNLYLKLHLFMIFTLHVTINLFSKKLFQSWLVLLIWNLIHIIIDLGLPLYFLKLQQYKNELQGPWDVAKPKLE